MANPTMTLIASNTVGSGGVSSVTFSSIPATYTDLVVKVSARTDTSSSSAGQWLYVNFNGATTNNSTRILYGIGSGGSGSISGSSPTPYAVYVNPSDYTANTFSNGEIYISNYTSSNFKSYSVDSVNENNATVAGMDLTAGLWSNTAAITSINLSPAGGNFVQYSTFYLYGINNS